MKNSNTVCIGDNRLSGTTPVRCDIVISYHEAALPLVPIAIDSALGQQNAECIVHVIADALPWNEEEKIKKLYTGIPNLHFYRNEESIGPYQSLHTIFHALETDYIAIQDSDDISLPHRIKHSIHVLNRESADIAGFAARNFLDSSSNDDRKLQSLLSREPISYSGVQNPAYPNGRVINGTMIVRTSIFQELNGFANWFCGCDAEFIERARAAGVPIATNNEVVILRRLRSNSISANSRTGMKTPYRNTILNEMHGRFTEFTPGFDPRKYGCLDKFYPGDRNVAQSPLANMKRQENRDNIKKVSACLLSWKRPKNMQKIVDHLRTHSFIDDIVIWNNNSEIDLNTYVQGGDVHIINHHENVGPYGRFLCSKHARHHWIFTQDDDCLVKDIEEIYATFCKDPSRIAYGLTVPRWNNRKAYIHESAQMAFIGWGGFFQKEWISVFDMYTKQYGEDMLLHEEADKIFSILQNRYHNTIKVNAEHLPGESGPEAMWIGKNHWKNGKEAEKRACSLLGISIPGISEHKESRMPEKFVVLTTPRTGSNFLVEVLDRHSDIRCYGELFHKSTMESARTLKPEKIMHSMKWRNANPLQFLENVWRQDHGKRITGMKLFFEHNIQVTDAVLQNSTIKKIVLRRRNVVRQYMSLQIALGNKNWGTRRANVHSGNKVHIDCNALQKFSEKVHSQHAVARGKIYNTGQQCLEIMYEDIVGPDREYFLKEVYDFLAVEYIPGIASDLIKQNPEPLSELIENFSEIEEALKGTAYEWMLYGDEYLLDANRKCTKQLPPSKRASGKHVSYNDTAFNQRPKKKKFVILGSGRSGNTWLFDYLNKYPDVLCHGELFHKERIIYSWEYKIQDMMSTQWRDANTKKFMRRVWKCNFGNRVVGFVLFFSHNPAFAISLMEDVSVAKILLRRRNVIRQYVSMQIGFKTGQWNISSDMEKKKEATIHIDSMKIQAFIERTHTYFESAYKILSKQRQPYLQLYYEDIHGPFQEEYLQKLCHFLGVQYVAGLTSSLRKQNPEPLSELIENFSEIEEALKGTAYESMLCGDEYLLDANRKCTKQLPPSKRASEKHAIHSNSTENADLMPLRVLNDTSRYDGILVLELRSRFAALFGDKSKLEFASFVTHLGMMCPKKQNLQQKWKGFII